MSTKMPMKRAPMPKNKAVVSRVAKVGNQVSKKKTGRPSKYTDDLANEIAIRISEGEPLRQICRDEHMPHWTVVYDWMASNSQFSLRIAQAREKGEEAIAQECMAIADEPPSRTAMGSIDSGDVQHKKLRIETRLKLLAKWNPRKWGEKVDLNHGVQPDNPLADLLKQIQGTPLKPNSTK